MGFPILVRWHLYTESAPWWLSHLISPVTALSLSLCNMWCVNGDQHVLVESQAISSDHQALLVRHKSSICRTNIARWQGLLNIRSINTALSLASFPDGTHWGRVCWWRSREHNSWGSVGRHSVRGVQWSVRTPSLRSSQADRTWPTTRMPTGSTAKWCSTRSNRCVLIIWFGIRQKNNFHSKWSQMNWKSIQILHSRRKWSDQKKFYPRL